MSFKFWENLAKKSQKRGMGGMVGVRGAVQKLGPGMGAGGTVGWVTVYTLNEEGLCPSPHLDPRLADRVISLRQEQFSREIKS